MEYDLYQKIAIFWSKNIEKLNTEYTVYCLWMDHRRLQKIFYLFYSILCFLMKNIIFWYFKDTQNSVQFVYLVLLSLAKGHSQDELNDREREATLVVSWTWTINAAIGNLLPLTTEEIT